MQDKDALKKAFSDRLRNIMLCQGFLSDSAMFRMRVNALCEAIGVSYVMVIRYLEGKALPTINTILKIAEWLKVEPAYLLFGEITSVDDIQKNFIIKINKQFFEYALEEFFYFFHRTNKKAELLKFFLKLMADLSTLEEEKEELKNIFDMALQSSQAFILE